jgi:hypothetical protein
MDSLTTAIMPSGFLDFPIALPLRLSVGSGLRPPNGLPLSRELDPAIGRIARALCANIGETPDYSIISEQGGKEDNLCW